MRTRFFCEFTDAIHCAIETPGYLTYLNFGQCDAWRIDQEAERANAAQKVARHEYLKHINEQGCCSGT
jgi:hypothetical protein